MAIKISGSTIIDDSRVVVNADKIGIGTPSPNRDLEILSTNATGIGVSAASLQETDSNKAISVYNAGVTTTFAVSYKGRVDAAEYFGTFKGDIDTDAAITNANKLKINTTGIASDFTIPFISTSATDSSYQNFFIDNDQRTSLRFNASDGRLQINGSGRDLLTIRTTNNSADRAIAFQNSGNNYVGAFGFIDRSGNQADLAFFTGNGNATLTNITETMRLTKESTVGVGTTRPDGLLHVFNGNAIVTGGNIGIGTTIPETELHISGTGTNEIRIDTDATGLSFHNHSEFMGFMGNDSGKLFINAGGTQDTLSLRTGGAERISIIGATAVDGKVGIGSTIPTTKLDVFGQTELDDLNVSGVSTFVGLATFKNNVSIDGSLTATGDGTFDDIRVGEWSHSADYAGVFHKNQTSNEYMLLSRDENTFISATTGYDVVIRGGGNVSTNQIRVHPDSDGIQISGNTTFYNNIDVDGNIIGDNATAITGISRISGSVPAAMAVQNVQYVGRSSDPYGFSFLNFDDQNVPPFGSGGNFTTLASISGLNLIYDTNDNDNNGFVVGVGSTNVSDANAFTAHMVIDHTGKVGFGTNSPVAKLDVAGKILAGDSITHPNLSNTLDTSANSGETAFRPINLIDTSSLIKLARLHDDFGPGLDLLSWNANLTTLRGRSLISMEGGDLKVMMRDGSSTLEKLRITSAGDVGIGTTNPIGANAVTSANTATLAVGILTARKIFGPVTGALEPTGDLIVPGDITISNSNPTLTFTEDDDNPDYRFIANNGTLALQEIQDSHAERFVLNEGGQIEIQRDLDIGRDLNVSGVSTFVGITTQKSTLFSTQLSNSGVSTFHDTVDIKTSGGSVIQDATGTLDLRSNIISLKNADNTATFAVFNNGASSELRFNNSKKIETTNDGVLVSGIITAVDGSFTGNVSIAGTLTYEDVTNVDSIGLITARTGIKLTAAEGQIEATGSTGLTLNASDSSAYARVRVAGDTRLHINSDGNVGIGTDNPQDSLHVHSDGSFNDGRIRFTRFVDNPNKGFIFEIDTNRDLVINRLFNAAISSLVKIKNQGQIVPDTSATTSTLGETGNPWDNVFGTTLTTNDKIEHNGNTNTAIRFPDTDTFSVDTAGTERLRITSDGHVGIGTINPIGVNALTNNNTTLAVGIVTASEVYGTFKGTIDSGVTIATDKIEKGNTKAQVVDTGSDGHFLVETEGTERLRITGIGSVGIGTEDPVTELDVIGDSSFEGDVSLNRGNITSTLTRTLSIGGARNQGNHFAAIELKNYDSDSSPVVDYVAAKITGTVPSTPTNGGELVFYTSPTGGDPSGITVQERLRINAGGNVGIGTDNPLQKLNVYNGTSSDTGGILVQNVTYAGGVDKPYLIVGTKDWTGATTNWNTFGFQHRIKSTSPGGVPRVTIDSANGELFCVDNSGNVGIGTANPDGVLHISSGTANSDCVLIIESDTDDNDESSNPQIWFKQDGDKNVGFVGQNSNTLVISNNVSSAGGISFRTGTTNNTGTTDPLTSAIERLRINSVGITSVQGQDDQDNFIVDVNGTEFAVHTDATDGEISLRAQDRDGSTNSKFMTFYTQESGSTAAEKLRITSDGDVGIGTEIPKSRLEVAGSAAVLTITDTRNASYSVGDTLSSLAFDSYDKSGSAGSSSHPRAKINLVTENTFGSKTGLSFATKSDTNHAPSEKMRITHDGHVGIGTTDPSHVNALTNNNNILAVGILTATTIFGNVVGGISDTGDVNINGNLSVTGNTTLGNGNEDLTAINGNLSVTGNTTLGNGDDDLTTINGNLTIQDANPILTFIDSTNNSDFRIEVQSGQFRIQDDTKGDVNRLHINSSGNIGIGTSGFDGTGNVGIGTFPDSEIRLKVVRDGLDKIIQQWGGNQGNAGHRFMELYSPANDDTNDYFRFQTGNAIKFRIDHTDAIAMNSSGNVAIGTDSPTSKLHVIDSVANSIGIATLLTLHCTRTDMLTGHEVGGSIRFLNEDGNNKGQAFIQANCPNIYNNDVDNEGERERTVDFNFVQSNASLDNLNTRLTIKGETGNVGIGVTDPQGRLHVENVIGTATTVIISQQKTYGVGSGTAERARLDLAIREANHTADNRIFGRIETGPESETTSEFSFLAFSTRKSSSISERLRIDSNGVLKIERGSASDTALEINTTSTSNACRIRFNESATEKAQIAYSHDNDKLELIAHSGNTISFFTDGTEKVQLNTDGDLLRTGTSQDIGASGAPWDKIYANEFIGEINVTQTNLDTGNLFVTGIATFQGNVSIAGTLTYEDVTNIDSLGIITARNGIHVTGAGVSVSGISTFINNVEFQDKVGIGTDSPLSILHIVRSTNSDEPSLVFPERGTNTRYSTGLGSKHVHMVGQRLDFYAGDSGSNTSNLGSSARRMSLTAQGRLGIGTTNPEKRLEVHGTFKVKDQSGKDNLEVDGAEGIFKVLQSKSAWSNMTHNPMPILAWDYKSGPGDLMYMGSGGNTPTNNQMALVISDNHGFKVGRSGYDGSDFDVSSTAEYFRITKDGNVGIGTNIPDQKLHVYNGSGNVTSFVEAIAGDAVIDISNSGNGNFSGINFKRQRKNDDDGNEQLGISGGSIFMPSNTANNEAFLYIQAQSANAHAGQTGALSDNNGVRLKLHGDDGIFSIETGASERLRVTADGDVGIGTDNPIGTGAVTSGNTATLAVGILTARQIFGPVTGSISTNENVDIGGNLDVDGATTLDGLTVSEAAVFSSSVTVNSGSATDEGNLAVHGTGKNSLIIRTTDNNADRGIAWRNSGAAYLAYIAAISRGNHTADLVFGVHNSNNADVNLVPERMRITKDGNVGIGTTIADRLLHIESNGNSYIRLTDNDITAETDSAVGVIEFETKDTNDAGVSALIGAYHENTSGNSYLKFNTGNASTISEKLRITSTGILELERGSATEQAIDIKSTATTGACRIRFVESGTSKGELAYSHNNDQLELVARSGNQIVMFTDGTTEKVRINLDGDLLRGGTGQDIGASDARWDVGYFNTINATNITGTLTAGSDKQVIFNSSGTLTGSDNLAFDSSNKRLGIGYNAPAATLSVHSATLNVESEAIRLGRISSNSPDLRFHSILTNHSATDSKNYIQFNVHHGGNDPFTGQAEVLNLLGNGRVGIGSTIPQAKLDVRGDINFNNNMLISNEEIGNDGNIDHIWHNDAAFKGFNGSNSISNIANGTWNFVSDGSAKVTGNSAIQAGYIISSSGGSFMGDVGIGTTNPHGTNAVNSNNTAKLSVGIVTAREYFGTFKGTIDSSVSQVASQITVTEDNDSTTYRVPFASVDTGTASLLTSAGITFRANNNKLTVSGGFIGDLTGQADGADQIKTQALSTNQDRYITFVGASTADATNKYLYSSAGIKFNPGQSKLTVSGNINANGNIIGDDSTDISGINSVTATEYFGTFKGTIDSGITIPNATNATNSDNVKITESDGESGTNYIFFGDNNTEGAYDGVRIAKDALVYKDAKLGVGTNDPTSKLHVFERVGNSNGVVTLLTLVSNKNDMTPGTETGGAIKFLNSDDNNSGEAFIQVNAPSSHSSEGAREKTVDFNFKQTNNGTLGTTLTIKGQGDVGIGTIDPTGANALANNNKTLAVGIVTANSGFFTNLEVSGTLTYEDVTNIDSVGVITAQNGIHVTANGIDAVGVITATSFEGNLNASDLSQGTVNTARLPTTITHAAKVTIQATGATHDIVLDSADNIIFESGEEEDGAIYFRGNSGDDSYRFSKGGQTSIEGFLSFESLTADRTFTFPNATGTLALTSDIPASGVTDVAVTQDGRSSPCILPITVTGTSTKTIGISTLSNAFGGKYIGENDPTVGYGTSVCDGDIWYDTSGISGITTTVTSTNTTLVISDVGTLKIATGTGDQFTVPANVFSPGDYMSFHNHTAAIIDIVTATNVTIYLSGSNVSVSSGGEVKLSPRALATLTCIVGGTSPQFVISGGGVYI